MKTATYICRIVQQLLQHLLLLNRTIRDGKCKHDAARGESDIIRDSNSTQGTIIPIRADDKVAGEWRARGQVGSEGRGVWCMSVWLLVEGPLGRVAWCTGSFRGCVVATVGCVVW